MTSTTRNILILLAAAVGAILVVGAAVLFATSLYLGTTAIPEGVQHTLWTAVVGLVVVTSTAISVYINSRAIALNRQISGLNHIQTHTQVSALTEKVENGLPARTAAIVETNAAAVALNLLRTNQEQALANLTARVDTLLAAQMAAPQQAAAPARGNES